jgi:hypothetical protein
MAPKEKELYDKYADEFNFDDTYRGYKEQSKQYALIVANEIIHYLETILGLDDTSRDSFMYWYEVKQEIEKL